MTVRNAELEDMKQLGHIMAVSFRTAFADFVSQQTMDACAQEDNCAAMLECIYQEGKMHFLIGENSGMLVWQKVQDSAEIVAIHSLPESWGTGLGHAMLEEALNQIGISLFFSGLSRRTNGHAASTKSTVSTGMAVSVSASLTAPWKCGM